MDHIEINFLMHYQNHFYRLFYYQEIKFQKLIRKSIQKYLIILIHCLKIIKHQVMVHFNIINLETKYWAAMLLITQKCLFFSPNYNRTLKKVIKYLSFEKWNLYLK